jgi:hypothetical protein
MASRHVETIVLVILKILSPGRKSFQVPNRRKYPRFQRTPEFLILVFPFEWAASAPTLEGSDGRTTRINTPTRQGTIDTQKKSVLIRNSWRCALGLTMTDRINKQRSSDKNLFRLEKGDGVDLKKKKSRKLLQWYRKQKRSPPEKNHGPYAIYSEIMLQQTQVATVIPYYQKFQNLSQPSATGEGDFKSLKAWEGLGYYSRARNLHRASRIVSKHFNGKNSG